MPGPSIGLDVNPESHRPAMPFARVLDAIPFHPGRLTVSPCGTADALAGQPASSENPRAAELPPRSSRAGADGKTAAGWRAALAGPAALHRWRDPRSAPGRTVGRGPGR